MVKFPFEAPCWGSPSHVVAKAENTSTGLWTGSPWLSAFFSSWKVKVDWFQGKPMGIVRLNHVFLQPAWWFPPLNQYNWLKQQYGHETEGTTWYHQFVGILFMRNMMIPVLMCSQFLVESPSFLFETDLFGGQMVECPLALSFKPSRTSLPQQSLFSRINQYTDSHTMLWLNLLIPLIP